MLTSVRPPLPLAVAIGGLNVADFMIAWPCGCGGGRSEFCRPPFFVTLFRKWSFAVAGPHMWNDLPIDVRSAQSLTAFRKHLKNCLFRRHYLA